MSGNSGHSAIHSSPKRFEFLTTRFRSGAPHPRQIIPLSITGNLSNKIIKKGLAFRSDRSATVLASGALLPLRDPAPPAEGLLRGFGGAAGRLHLNRGRSR